MSEYNEVMESLRDRLESEGVDYTLVHYSNWEEIQDIDPDLFFFIQRFREGRNQLVRYVKNKHGWDID